jgi:hypothetical protein
METQLVTGVLSKANTCTNSFLQKNPRSLLDAKFVEGISSIMLLNCVSGVRSDLETQQVVEQFSYMSKIYFLVFHYS